MSRKATIARPGRSWRLVEPHEQRRYMCASSNCDDTAWWSFDYGGVGSYYCDACKARIEGAQKEFDAKAHRMATKEGY